jgi:hypothetical protein
MPCVGSAVLAVKGMRTLAFTNLFLAAVCSVFGQSELQPKYSIPASLAKLPEPADFMGVWLRSDGGYRLEVLADSESPQGVVVRYFNPAPIQVESASFLGSGAQLALLIVLRDTGYDGSTYQLEYRADRCALAGTYTRPGNSPAPVYFVNQAEQ